MQAARGTALSHAAVAPSPRRLSRRAGGTIAVAVALAGVALDQVAKALAVARLDPAHPVSLLGGFLRLQLVRNPGAAFSLGESTTWLFALLAIAATLALAALAVPRLRMPWWAVVVGLFLAGIVGNLIDRLVRPPGFLRGHVVDFFQLPHWAIFNVADMCICVGAALLVLLSLVGRYGPDGRASARRGRGA